MDRLTLYIGNKNYSSWSFRPWIALEGCGVAFEEVLIPFDFPGGNPRIREVSPTGKVPMLVHGGFKVWESLAIIEYVAGLFPEAGLWPKDRAARAEARSVSMEMLSGFRALRNACPMNIRRAPGAIDLPGGVMDDVARIETIWKTVLDGSSGPFLFGKPSLADAFFAPVAVRLRTYRVEVPAEAAAYIETIYQWPAFQAWQQAGLEERKA